VGNGPTEAVDPLGLTDSILDPLMRNVVEPVVNGAWNFAFGQGGVADTLMNGPDHILKGLGLDESTANGISMALPLPGGKLKCVEKGLGSVMAAKQAAKQAFKKEAGDATKKVIRDRTTDKIKGVGAGNATYRPKPDGSYSVTPQSGNAADTQHFRP